MGFWVPSVSADGRYVAYIENGDGVPVVYDRLTHATERISEYPAVLRFGRPNISADGRFVVFSTTAALLSADTNGLEDVYLYDRSLHTTERISVAANGAQGDGASSFPGVSGDGSVVVFQSGAKNLVPDDTVIGDEIFVVNRTAHTVSRVSQVVGTDGGGYSPSISADGHHVAYKYAGERIVNASTGEVEAALGYPSLGIDKEQTGPGLSADGRFLVSCTPVTDPVHGGLGSMVYVYDAVNGTYDVVSSGLTGSPDKRWNLEPSISSDGRYVAFEARSDPGVDLADSNIYVVDRVARTTELVSVPTSEGPTAQGPFQLTAMSGDGGVICFTGPGGEPGSEGSMWARVRW